MKEGECRILVRDMYVYMFSSFFLSLFFLFLDQSTSIKLFQTDKSLDDSALPMMTLISRNKNSCSRLGKLMSYTRATDRRVAQLGRRRRVVWFVLSWFLHRGTLWVVRGGRGRRADGWMQVCR